MAAWPAQLPQGMLRGFRVQPADTVLRTDMDVGLAKVRRRSSYTPLTAEGEIACSQAQVEMLELFYLETTKNGTIRFSINAPHTDAPMEARFREPPSFVWLGLNRFTATIRLELTVTAVGYSPAVWPDGTAWIWPDTSRALWPRSG